MEEDEIGRVVVEIAVQVHRKIGPGLLETLNFSGFLMKNGITRIANHLFE
ncbi:MAG TPA: hypothetical protein VGQ22_13190 [Steroidobacteraceae bacterium]|jgi:hypothetical protein|nr:hypothetical protein [Steroidobacteraceae bacterium]